VARWFDRREVQQDAIPGSGGSMSARGLARMYAMLASGGELDGVRILSQAAMSLGYRLGPGSGPGAGPNAFGHVGGGGSLAYVDPDRHFAPGFARNNFTCNASPPPGRRAGAAVADAVLSALDLA
jgi:CubicO group peptidase (beta-lactamase class C family)